MSPELMLAYRLIRLIESHSEELVSTYLQRSLSSEKTRDYLGKVPPEDLKERVYEIYRHLRQWLQDESESDLAQRYLEIGSLRAQQGVPLTAVIWAIVLVKDVLFDFLKKQTAITQVAEVFGQLEVLQLLEQFFDRAIYYAAAGYERHSGS
jgi:hypothetical protein